MSSYFALKNNPFTDDSVEVWEQAEQKVPEAVDAASLAANTVFAHNARRHADRMKWPMSAIEQIDTFRDEDGDWRAGLPEGPEADLARSLEYGSEKFGPQPVFRNSARRSKKEAQETFAAVLNEHLFGEG